MMPRLSRILNLLPGRTSLAVLTLPILLATSATGALALCGNGLVEVDETCDEGAANGTSTSCCSHYCLIEAAGTTCRAASGVCDVAEVCDGTTPTCPADGVKASTVECRASAGACDVAENCDGTNKTCPADGFKAGTVECRAANGVCDVAENCTGASAACPADGFASSTVLCRAAASANGAFTTCDVDEYCTGSSASCPPNGFAADTVVCRPSTGLCDAAENCTGNNANCPNDRLDSAGTVCRAAAGLCDIAETCDGVSADCPDSDAVETAGTLCRAADGDCDVPESCDGSSGLCPGDGFKAASVVCRAAASANGAFTSCDIPENCTGSSAACPADVVKPSTVACRLSAGVCDAAENCTGTTNSCPSDTKLPSSTLCRASTDLCDAAEYCTGTGNACPSDMLAGQNTVCRPASDICDVAERCDGTTAACPSDGVKPDLDTDGLCDAIDNCVAAANPDQADQDLDGAGDVCDECSSLSTASFQKIVAGNYATLAQDDRLSFRTKLLFPAQLGPASVPDLQFDNNPRLYGLRVLLVDAEAGTLFDVDVPPGTWDSVNKCGWTRNKTGTNYNFKCDTLVGGVINKVRVNTTLQHPEIIKVFVSGSQGSFASGSAGAALVNTPPTMTVFFNGQATPDEFCGDSRFPQCSTSSTKISCKQ